MKNAAIIGGGAAGLACALMIKKRMPGIDVTVFEANDRVGKKLAVTGNGRCNISNKYASSENYHGDPQFAEKLLNDFDFNKQSDFFSQLGVLFAVENDGKTYPMSYQASSVVDAMRYAAKEEKIKVILSTFATDITKKADGEFEITTNNGKHIFAAVIIATGGKAGGKLSSEFGYTILKKFGHKIETLSPSLVQIKTNTDCVKQLKGIKINAAVTVKTEKEKRSESGEILFCDYGLSGPPVLQISRLANARGALIVLDILPDFDISCLQAELEKRCSLHPQRAVSELFTGMINKRLGQVITKSCGININSLLCELTVRDIAAISKKVKHFELTSKGTAGFENAQVTAGGAQTTQFFDCLMSKKVKGLFAVGEVLNVDGDCGGYNLAFAWASANAAANGVIKYLAE